ncbi:hypothetical protein ACGFNU_45460 [Spirillospora sp. NPDC048911]|uniref:hypothetical protein n=1 Tax=Spirillospora sp. NPDC048911 TaxID=3364527 RepID=UPI00371AB678
MTIAFLAEASAATSMNPAVWTASLVTGGALVAGLAWASRRLLGLPVGTARTAVGGLIGFSLPGLLAARLQEENPGLYFAVSLGSAVLAAMTFIVVAEALVPAGSLPRPHELVVATRRRLARTRRDDRRGRRDVARHRGRAADLPGRRVVRGAGLRAARGQLDPRAARPVHDLPRRPGTRKIVNG